MDSKVAFIDLQQAFEKQAKHGITNDRLLADHIHPRIEWHQFIAGLLTEQLERMGYVTGPSGSNRDELYDAHISNLPKGYYLQAEERLRGLQGWSAGRATKLAPEPIREGE